MNELVIDARKTILLIEDNPDDVELTLRALRKTGIDNEVIVVRDGEAALDLLCGSRASADATRLVPELILLDLNLPRIEGPEVLRRIRESASTRYVPVVVLTSSTEDSDLRRAYELGANSYIQKPVDFSKFLEAARALSLYWLALNVVPRGGMPQLDPGTPPDGHEALPE